MNKRQYGKRIGKLYRRVLKGTATAEEIDEVTKWLDTVIKKADAAIRPRIVKKGEK